MSISYGGNHYTTSFSNKLFLLKPSKYAEQDKLNVIEGLESELACFETPD